MTSAGLNNYLSNIKDIIPHHPSKRGYMHGDNMDINHLVVIIIYTGTDVKSIMFVIFFKIHK